MKICKHLAFGSDMYFDGTHEILSGELKSKKYVYIQIY